MPDNTLVSHLTPQTTLSSAIDSWQAYLTDKGRSPNTIKAFLSDVRLLTSFLPEETTIGKITTKDLNRYFEWIPTELVTAFVTDRGRLAPHEIPLATRQFDDLSRLVAALDGR